jgi:hypothetical protein
MAARKCQHIDVCPPNLVKRCRNSAHGSGHSANLIQLAETTFRERIPNGRVKMLGSGKDAQASRQSGSKLRNV